MSRRKMRRLSLARHAARKATRGPLCQQCKEAHETVIPVPTHAGLVFKCRRCRIEHARRRQATLFAAFRDYHGFDPTPDQLADFDRELRGLDRLAQIAAETTGLESEAARV